MNRLIVSPSPHVHGDYSTRRLMTDVLIALAPAVLVAIYFYGLSMIILLLTSILTCVLTEFVIQKYMMKTKSYISDGSAIVTGVLLALNLPPAAPWWIAVIGSLVAIGIAKMTFGGLGQNIFNPALVGRVFLLVSFPVIMTDWSVPQSWFSSAADAFTGATPLSVIKGGLAQGLTIEQIEQANPSLGLSQLFYLKVGGSAGEASALALIIGFVYMLVRRVIKPHIPLVIILTIFVMSGIFWLVDPQSYVNPVFSILTGGVLIGSIFMATDYVTSPMSVKGMVVYGIGIGVITVLIRMFGSFPEGISFAILIMNSVVPLLNKYLKPKRFGKEVANA